MTTLHIRHRIRGMRTRRQWHQAMSFAAAFIAALLFAILALWWIDSQLAKADAEEQKAIQASFKVSHLEQTWISCLENRAVWINDSLHSCKVMDTTFSKGDFK